MSEYQSSGSLPGASRTIAGFVADAALSAITTITTRSAKATRAIAVALAALIGSAAAAEAENRSLKLHFTHTGERAEITYKRNGRFDPKGLAQVNRILRDFRKNQSTKMDPRLLDLVWEVYDRSGATGYIHVVSAYRSPATNSMLRGRSRKSGVAKKSQHTLGKAMDFFIPGVKISTLRQVAMQMQVGGVGYYPTSGSPFVHLDVGNVRAWPRMSRKELARIFPNGRTMHLPADGRALPGYAEAVADYKRRVGSKSIQIASTAPDDDDDDTGSAKRSGSGLLTAMLPTPKSRAIEAFSERTSPKAAAAAASTEKADPNFVDLASLSVPAPSFRPSTAPAPIDPIQTAALAPALTLAPTPSPAPLPAIAAAPALRLPSPGRALKTPSGAIGLLPITPEFVDEEDEFDSDDALLSWALAAPGTNGGMTAPLLVRRAMSSVEAGTPAEPAPLPVAVSREFDSDRFWSGG
ncbi:DUF882 domain-containing protein [Rhizobium sp. NFR07]|uniref:DUF882 domain-containing protein n=1 Tax=Rhizobium sp. NFR07 TaxID=1566262 RepID=UPI001FCD728C|nr:DUF882 domain-containing protein [Rhizobium sp. NFR07]